MEVSLKRGEFSGYCIEVRFSSGSGTLTLYPVLVRERKERVMDTTRIRIRSADRT